jgi:hypothetical protein
MSAAHDPSCRQVYLLSLWRETADAPWRAALRPAGGSDRIGFPDLEALALFLLSLDDSHAVVIGDLDPRRDQEATE